MAVLFVDPRATSETLVTPYELAVDLHGDALSVGLLANGFPDSVAFLDQVEAALGESLPRVTFKRYNKRNASAIASEEMLATIASECGAVVAAYGH
jgi:hypothetical protein